MYQIKGKIDSANAAEFEKEIMAVKPAEIDASKLLYISSAGLRVLMKLRKEVGEVTISNVNKEVYEIFEVTGFTSILNVKKALREVSVEGCELIGEGGNGAVYRLNDDTIVKVYKAEIDVADLDDINREREYARTAFVNGIPSVIAYDMVKVGDKYGVVFEMLNSDTLGHAMRDNPEKLKEYYQKLGLLFAFNTVMICGSGASQARKLAPILMDKLLRGIVVPNEQTIKYLFKTM